MAAPLATYVIFAVTTYVATAAAVFALRNGTEKLWDQVRDWSDKLVVTICAADLKKGNVLDHVIIGALNLYRGRLLTVWLTGLDTVTNLNREIIYLAYWGLRYERLSRSLYSLGAFFSMFAIQALITSFLMIANHLNLWNKSSIPTDQWWLYAIVLWPCSLFIVTTCSYSKLDYASKGFRESITNCSTCIRFKRRLSRETRSGKDCGSWRCPVVRKRTKHE